MQTSPLEERVVYFRNAFLMGCAVELIIMRPLRNAPLLSIVVVSIGLFVIFHSLAEWLFGFDVHEFPSALPPSSGRIPIGSPGR